MYELKQNKISFNKKTIIYIISILVCFMIISYALSFFATPIPFWKFLVSPVLVLFSDSGLTILGLIFFLVVVGSILNVFSQSGMVEYMISKISSLFCNVRYNLLCILILFFMWVGGFLGSFEEIVPVIPFIILLCLGFGWDSYTGFFVSLFACGCGFSAGVCNPFTVLFAQKLTGLSSFSGMWMRMLVFILVYLILILYIRKYISKNQIPVVHRSVEDKTVDEKEDLKKKKAIYIFLLTISFALIFSISITGFPEIQPFTLPIMSIIYLIGVVCICKLIGMKTKSILKTLFEGFVSVIPVCVILILTFAIRYIVEESSLLSLYLDYVVSRVEVFSPWLTVIAVFFVSIVLNFFIPSASAKITMLTPVLFIPAQSFGISTQLCIAAFIFGEGFSNLFLPTSPVLLISLSMTDINYTQWIKKSWKVQLAIFFVCIAVLILGYFAGY